MGKISSKKDTKKKTFDKFDVVKANFLNYGVFFFGYVMLYIVIISICQMIFSEANVVATIIANVIISVLSFFLYFSFKYKKKLPSFQSKAKLNPQVVTFWVIYLTIASYILLTLFQWLLLKFPDDTMIQTNTTSTQPFILTLFISCVVAPLAEESMIRIYAYNQLKRSSNWITAMIVSSLTFAILHGTTTHIIMGLLFGILLTISYESTGCCLIPVIGHSIYNLMVLVMPANMFFPTNTVFVVIIVFVFAVITALQLVVFDKVLSQTNYKDMLYK